MIAQSFRLLDEPTLITQSGIMSLLSSRVALVSLVHFLGARDLKNLL